MSTIGKENNSSTISPKKWKLRLWNMAVKARVAIKKGVFRPFTGRIFLWINTIDSCEMEQYCSSHSMMLDFIMQIVLLRHAI